MNDENIKKGYIKVYRSLMDHYLFDSREPYSKREAWIDILLTVNHKAAKMVIKGHVLTVERGQSLLSLESWGKRWRWDKNKVKRFLHYLKNDDMICLENATITTRLTVCNFDTYNPVRNDNDTKTTRRTNGDDTVTTQWRPPNNNVNNDNNDNNINIPPIPPEGESMEPVDKKPKKRKKRVKGRREFNELTPEEQIKCTSFLSVFNEVTGRDFKTMDAKTISQFLKLVAQNFTKGNFKNTILAAKKEMGRLGNLQWLTPEYITRPAKFDVYYKMHTDAEITAQTKETLFYTPLTGHKIDHSNLD